ncbi:MAG TPA: hypothetical protein PK455_03230 [Caldisericia bacterium]|nr:hypothetical protein [Caldisericia bacterium]
MTVGVLSRMTAVVIPAKAGIQEVFLLLIPILTSQAFLPLHKHEIITLILMCVSI